MSNARFTSADLAAMQQRLSGKAPPQAPVAAPAAVSASFKRRNPHLYGPQAQLGTAAVAGAVAGTGKRLRQSGKARVSKFELAWGEVIKRRHLAAVIRAQQMTFPLCNGCSYKPDWYVVELCMVGTAGVTLREIAYECKGGRGMKGESKGAMTIKLAAAAFPDVTWVYVWKGPNGEWCEQTVLPPVTNAA